MTYTVYSIASHPGERSTTTPGCYMMIDGYILCCEGSITIESRVEFELLKAETFNSGDAASYALVVTNEDQTTEVIDWF